MSKKEEEIFENIDKEFSRLEELGLLDKAKGVYTNIKDKNDIRNLLNYYKKDNYSDSVDLSKINSEFARLSSKMSKEDREAMKKYKYKNT